MIARNTSRVFAVPTGLERWYSGLLAVAAAWAAVNCAYVYFVLGGARGYRIESSVYVFLLLILPAVLVSKEEPVRTRPETTRPEISAIALAVVAWLVLLLPFATSPFLSDDYVFLGVYGRSLDLTYRWAFFRPAFGVAFWILSNVGHLSPIPFHLAGYVLHLLNASLVYALTRRLSGASLQATIAFIIFLLNPLQLEATLWVSGLQELLWSGFALAAVMVHTARRELSAGRIGAVAVLTAAALLSKETAVCFVLLFLLFDFVLFRMDRGPLLVRSYIVYIGVLIGYVLVRHSLTSFDPRFIAQPTQFFAKQFLAIPYKTFVQPWNTSAIHVPFVLLFMSAASAIALVLFAVVVRKASPRLLVGPAIILIGTIPLYGFFFVGANLTSARYLYLPAAGWAIMIAYVFTRSAGSRASVLLMLFMVASTYAYSLHLNLRPWRTAIQVVARMTDTSQPQQALDEVVSRLQRELGPDLEVEGGIPRQYQGVGIFINGYSEFLALNHGK